MFFYYILAYFLIYSVLGWCLEVAYAAITTGKVVNRGFLNGPVCPIYGFGMIAVLYLLRCVMHSSLLLFFCGLVLTSTIELIGGFALYKIYHARWWDYSKRPFNIGGFVCLEFSIYWGLGVLFAMRILHPSVERFVHIFPIPIGWIIMAFMSAIYMGDLIVTVNTVSGMHKDLQRLEILALDLHHISEKMSEDVGGKTLEIEAKVEEGRLQAALRKMEIRDLLEDSKDDYRMMQNEWNKLFGKLTGRDVKFAWWHRYTGLNRILKAFPDLQSERHSAAVEELKKRIRKE